MKCFKKMSAAAAAIIVLFAIISSCVGVVPHCTIEEQNITLPDTSCCYKYYICDKEIATHYDCPPGEVLDRLTNVIFNFLIFEFKMKLI